VALVRHCWECSDAYRDGEAVGAPGKPSCESSLSRKRLLERVVNAAVADSGKALVWRIDGIAVSVVSTMWGETTPELLLLHIFAHNSLVAARAAETTALARVALSKAVIPAAVVVTYHAARQRMVTSPPEVDTPETPARQMDAPNADGSYGRASDSVGAGDSGIAGKSPAVLDAAGRHGCIQKPLIQALRASLTRNMYRGIVFRARKDDVFNSKVRFGPFLTKVFMEVANVNEDDAEKCLT